MNILTNKMKYRPGFSLTEMLLATGIMAIGLVMIATIFPVGVKLTSLSTERTVGSIVADEAFAKVQLYGLRNFIYWPQTWINESGYTDPTRATYDSQSDFLDTTKGVLYKGSDLEWGTEDDTFIWLGPNGIPNAGSGDDTTDNGDFLTQFRFPSVELPEDEASRYHWSALCRRTGPVDIQVTVFVTRKSIGGVTHYNYAFNYPTKSYESGTEAIWPAPVKVNVEYSYSNGLRQLVIDDTDTLNASYGVSKVYSFFGDGFTIVDDRTGTIYRVSKTEDTDGDGVAETITLLQDWQWQGYPGTPTTTGTVVESVWVVPPGVGSTRYPCVGVYQKILRFDGIN